MFWDFNGFSWHLSVFSGHLSGSSREFDGKNAWNSVDVQWGSERGL